MNIDPKSEQYLNISTYSYVGNDPINYLDPNGKWRIRGGKTHGSRGNPNGNVTFNYSFNSLVKNEVIGGDKFGMTPYVGLIQSLSNIGEGFRTGSWSVGMDGGTDMLFAAVGGKWGKTFANKISGGAIASEFASFMTSLLGDTSIGDTVQALFVDNFVTNSLLEEGAIVANDNSETTGTYTYSSEYISDLKSTVAEENGLDVNDRKDQRKLERKVNGRLNERAKTIERQAIDSYKKLLKEKSEKANKRD